MVFKALCDDTGGEINAKGNQDFENHRIGFSFLDDSSLALARVERRRLRAIPHFSPGYANRTSCGAPRRSQRDTRAQMTVLRTRRQGRLDPNNTMLVARIYNRLIGPAILTAKPNKSFEFIIESAASFFPMMQDQLCGDLRPNSVRDCGVETKKHSVIICDNCMLSAETDRSSNARRQSFVCMLRENSLDAAIRHEPH
jgi:hypothetical protein